MPNGEQPGADTASVGRFRTVVACDAGHACPNGSMDRPFFMQTWQDSKGGGLRVVVANQSISFVGAPPAFAGGELVFTRHQGHTVPFYSGVQGPSATIARAKDDSLVAAFYGYAAHDQPIQGPNHYYYTIAYFGAHK